MRVELLSSVETPVPSDYGWVAFTFDKSELEVILKDLFPDYNVSGLRVTEPNCFFRQIDVTSKLKMIRLRLALKYMKETGLAKNIDYAVKIENNVKITFKLLNEEAYVWLKMHDRVLDEI